VGGVELVRDPQAEAGLERAGEVGEVRGQAHVPDPGQEPHVGLIACLGGIARQRGEDRAPIAVGGLAVRARGADREAGGGAHRRRAGGLGQRRSVGAVARDALLIGGHQPQLHRRCALGARIGVDRDRLPVIAAAHVRAIERAQVAAVRRVDQVIEAEIGPV
jgi:hypothetical protein